MEKNLLLPKYDIVFQTLFSRLNEKITKSFISDILNMKIEKINLNVDKNLVKRYAEEKLGVLDLRAELNNGIQCNIEIQLSTYDKIIERFLSYWARLYTENLKSGDTYGELKRTICVFIVDEQIVKLKDIIKSHTKWQIREEKNREIILTNDFEMHIIELPKALEEYKKKPKDNAMQWMKFLDNPNDMEVRKIMQENEDIKKANEKLEEISSDDTLRRLAELREKGRRDEAAKRESAINEGLRKGMERGLQEGREQGIQQAEEEAKKEKIKNIKKLLELGIDKEKIAEGFGITLKDIEEYL